MYWLQRPPYLRWASAALLVVGALAWDLRRPALEDRPFTSRAVAAGEALDDDAVVWRRVPAGLLPAADLTAASPAVDLGPGEPLTPAVLRGPVAVPEGWWEIPVPIGAHARPGDRVMLLPADGAAVTGLVVSAASGDAYSLDYRPAVVAVPPEAAPAVAAAAAAGSLVAAVSRGG